VTGRPPSAVTGAGDPDDVDRRFAELTAHLRPDSFAEPPATGQRRPGSGQAGAVPDDPVHEQGAAGEAGGLVARIARAVPVGLVGLVAVLVVVAALVRVTGAGRVAGVRTAIRWVVTSGVVAWSPLLVTALVLVVVWWGRRRGTAPVRVAISRVPRGTAPAGAVQSAPAGAVRSAPAGAAGFYLVAVMSMLVSIDTSWRFFEYRLHITNPAERGVMFAVIEAGLLACGYGMRANVRLTGRPGAPRLFAWLLCALAGYMAWQLSGMAAGLARVVLGPALGLVMLHLALGIEVRAGTHRATTWARIGRELRERLLSRVGLSDDERDALARTRDRAARRAARLSLGTWVPWRAARVARALRASNVAHDPAARTRLLAELATIRHAAELATLDQPSPWQPTTAPAGSPVHRSVNTAVNGPVNTDTSLPPGATAPGRARRPAAATSRAVAGRRPVADYVAQAREHLTPGVRVTPAWVRQVVPGCPRSTSKHVADALNQHRHTDDDERR